MAILVGVAGGTGSGKTSFAQKILERLGPERCVTLAQDSYYKDGSTLSDEDRAAINYDHPDAFDTSLLIQDLRDLKAGRPVPVPVHPSFISGAGAPTVLKEMWPLISALVDETMVVPVSGVAAAIRFLCGHNHVVAEGAGAIAVAAALAGKAPPGKTVCVVSGGNIDLEVMAKILQQQL